VKFPERWATVGAFVAALLLFFHPHVESARPAKSTDCTKRQGGTREITLRPETRRQFIWIKLCDHLTLINGYPTPLYPAPGPHPHHDSFPELDVRRHLAPGETWSSVLSRPGNYQLHDHDTEKILVELTILGVS